MITVFLADDHTIVRDGLRLILDAQPDIEVIGDAGDGREAVRLVGHTTPDIVIMDIAMPQLNGIDATREIREKGPLTQVIILSMHATNEHIFRALDAGARGYLIKESAGREVVDAVRAVSADHRYLSQSVSDEVIDDYVRQRGAGAPKAPLDTLSAREREVLQLVTEGRSSAEIARAIHLSPKTVETYRSRLMRKLGVQDLPGLVKFAVEHGLTPPG